MLKPSIESKTTKKKKKKKTLQRMLKGLWVEDRVRTGDLLNHNQAL